ncbi:hypothetical protein HYY69_04975 [Candidatus Woesearchaeota archaeon]|nr:hypothetical protein [Candidatus Woesearchaeota archaeon]
MEKQNKLNLENVILLVVGVFTIYLQIFPPATKDDQVKSIFYFVGAVIYIMVYYMIAWIREKEKVYINQTQDIDKRVHTLQANYHMQKTIYLIKQKVAILEALMRNKQGKFEIDYFKLFGLGGLLALFYLYLRSLGIVP